jgi:hypothetical protein
MRTKSKWFAKEQTREPQVLAGAVALNIWRLGLHSINRMRKAHFEIEASRQYFDFLREYLVFLDHIVDRFAFGRLSDEDRQQFTSALVKKTAEFLSENEARLLGGEESPIIERFIESFNQRGEDYATFSFVDGAPDFSFMRYCGFQLAEVVSVQDRHWVMDQVMAIEAPEAIDTLNKLMDNLFATAGKTEA